MRIYIFFIIIMLLACQRGEVQKYTEYLNHHDTVSYVGKETCKQCHYDIYQSFSQTGMGNSIQSPTKNSSAISDSRPIIFDKDKNLYYQPFWKRDSLWIHEFRLDEQDTIHSLKQKVNYIIGSGHHTNSHLFEINGYIHQIPYTYYTQENVADLPPGFENGKNTRFSRKIDLECMSCHNAYPHYISGSNNKFTDIPMGIDCERCHGPGEAHVKQKQAGILVDTSKYIDYSIVNPSKLPIDLQFDVCQRCHLQGTAVLHKNHTWVDFKPGHKLSDFMDIYLPKYENDESFIMASHADRLKQSACFKGSDISCLSCHNPHKSVHTLPSNYFDDKCMNCHSVCNDENNTSSCVSCHMPKSSSTDIPHVTITDHKIGIHSVETTEKGKFLGLIAINNEQPTYISKAKAYLKQYERFAQNPIYLDSAKFYLDKNKDHKNIAHLFIKYYYLKEDFTSLVNYSMQINDFQIPKEELGLTFARIGESCLVLDMSSKALQYYNLAHKHSSSNLTYQIKIGVIHIDNNQLDSAQIIFENVLLQYSKNKEALLNLGYVFILQKQYEEAKKMLEYLIQIEPDYLLAYENMVLLYLRQNNSVVAKSYLNKILEIEPNYKIQPNIINSFIIN